MIRFRFAGYAAPGRFIYHDAEMLHDKFCLTSAGRGDTRQYSRVLPRHRFDMMLAAAPGIFKMMAKEFDIRLGAYISEYAIYGLRASFGAIRCAMIEGAAMMARALSYNTPLKERCHTKSRPPEAHEWACRPGESTYADAVLPPLEVEIYISRAS